MSAFERSLSRIISMSSAYRTYPLAQAIEEAARIFGPEVTAAALLAAVEAVSVRSTTPSRSFRRKPWTTLAVVRSSSQTMSSCPITTNFVAFDEQQEVALGDLPPPPSLSRPFAV